MQLLIDTHAVLWWATDDLALPASARKQIAHHGSGILVSAVSAWEIATKFRLGRLAGASDLVADFSGFLARQKFQELSVTAAHGIRAGSLPGPHRDPFDRMLIAQAQAEDLAVVSNDEIFDHYGVRRFW